MTRLQFDDARGDSARLRAYVDGCADPAPELFPMRFAAGASLHGRGRESRKMPGVRLREEGLRDGSSDGLRPGFVLPSKRESVDDASHPLLLAAQGVPVWRPKRGFGRREMDWYLLVEGPGRISLVETTVRNPAGLSAHRAADEYHADEAGAKGCVAVTAGGGCLTGVALTPAADDAYPQAAYVRFAAEARDVDGAATAEEFRRLMDGLRDWCDGRNWTAADQEMPAELRNKTDAYAVAYDHSCSRHTRNAVDRPINRLLSAGRGLHGHQASSERRLRGWALLHNFRPFAPCSGPPRPHECLAHRLGGKRYHDHWLHNLMTATPLTGRRYPAPANRWSRQLSRGENVPLVMHGFDRS